MFIDTILICSATAFVILLGSVYVPGAEGVERHRADAAVAGLASSASWARYYLTFAVFLFAFSSIIYNYYLGETALAELTQRPGVGACAAHAPSWPSCCWAPAAPARHLGVLLLRPADGPAGAGQPDGRADAVPGGDARARTTTATSSQAGIDKPGVRRRDGSPTWTSTARPGNEARSCFWRAGGRRLERLAQAAPAPCSRCIRWIVSADWICARWVKPCG
ncbi:MAG: alanine:cation symporter family protein [Comamonadaceae bacterium]|nr:alanine:cation symporter family protein [Comamonadaceae bacterium]